MVDFVFVMKSLVEPGRRLVFAVRWLAVVVMILGRSKHLLLLDAPR